jgi:ketosteroid isomerase-like protein
MQELAQHTAYRLLESGPVVMVACALARGRTVATGRMVEQELVVFLKSCKGRINHVREYFDPLWTALALAVDEEDY